MFEKYSNVETLITTVICVVVVWGLCTFVGAIYDDVILFLKKRKIDRMAKKLRAQSRFRYKSNIDHDITGICRGVDFDLALRLYYDDVKEGKLNPWDKVVCKVVPTLTFAGSSETFRPIHTGIRSKSRGIFEEAIEIVTEESLEGLDREDIECLISIIVIRDTRLFVPYSGKSEMTGKEQLEMFGQYSHEEARKLLLKPRD